MLKSSNSSKFSQRRELWSYLWNIDVKGINLPIYIGMIIVLIATMVIGKIPHTIVGAISVLVILGNFLHYLGNKIPIIKSYLGGGSVFCIFVSAFLATFGILPANVIDTTKDFVSNMGFLDFYIAALITGSILGMNRSLLIKASVRFIPVAILSMLSCFIMVGTVGALIGNGFGKSILYIAFPVMAGGIGAGVVPLSTIYAHSLGASAGSIISKLIPASAMGNVLAIIGAALLVKLGENFPKINGHGQLIKESDESGEKLEDKDTKHQINVIQIGVGLLISFSFFMIGIICNYFVPKIHAYAFMIILVVIAKITKILPKYYEESAIMFNQVIVKNLTPAVLTGIGIALLNLNVLGQALTWQFIILCLTSIITISTAAGIFGKLFGLYPVESIVTAGMCNNSMGGTGNVAVLSSAKRMELIAFAQMGNRLGGATILIVSGFLTQVFS